MKVQHEQEVRARGVSFSLATIMTYKSEREFADEWSEKVLSDRTEEDRVKILKSIYREGKRIQKSQQPKKEKPAEEEPQTD